MNNQEAIEQLKFDKELAKRDYISPTNHEEYDLAISALEKQIPKKPYQSYYSKGDCEWVCSTCESTINEPHRKYCGWCGQHYTADVKDWSVEE